MGDRKRILACDLSLTGSAFSILDVIDGKPVIVDIRFCNNKTNAKLGHAQRLQKIRDTLVSIQLDYPDIGYICREKGFSRHAISTQAIFKVVGVTELAMYELWGIQIGKDDELAPTTVKRLIAGDGKASKEEVEEGVRQHLSDEYKTYHFYTDDCSDSVAVGLGFCIKKGWLL
jgi:crossover junction endodeoxyribonuclease RuvC